MSNGVIDCILVTPKGYVFHSLAFSQLQDARQLINAAAQGANIVFSIVTKDNMQVNTTDILMMYACTPNKVEDSDGG